MKVIFLDFNGVITSSDTKWKIDTYKIKNREQHRRIVGKL